MRTATTVLRGGVVVDGTGAQGVEADVAVSGARIVEIGSRLRGDVELDAKGAIVAPGFIDLHTHYDAQVFWDRAVTPSSWHGVTTVVLGNCGFGLAPCRPDTQDLLITMLAELEDMPRRTLEVGIDWCFSSFAEYLDALDGLGLHINTGAYIGHSPVRFEVMGAEAYERTATEEEVVHMAALVRAGIDAGAVGFATSASPTGRHHPTAKADYREVAALSHVLRESGVGIGSFVPAREIDIDRLYELNRVVGRPLTYTALMALRDGSHLDRVERHVAERAAGASVHPQVSCRPLIFEAMLDSAFALRAPSLLAIEHIAPHERISRYRDPSFRRTVESELSSMLQPPDWCSWRIDASPTCPELIGLDVASVARHRNSSGLDVVFGLAADDDLLTRFRITVCNDDRTEVARLLNLDGVVLGLSDAGAHPTQICDAVFPTDLLGPWVRDRGVMPLELAVRKLTGEPADLLNLRDRGYVREGAVADLVVVEPDAITPGPLRRAQDLPAGAERLVGDRPEGIRHVMVAGTAIRLDGSPAITADAPGPGRTVRSTKG